MFKSKKALEEKIKLLETERDRYMQMWQDNEIKLEECAKNATETADVVIQIVKDYQSLSDNNNMMIELLKIYAAWDNRIIQMMKEQGSQAPEEGPATIYLRQIGAFLDKSKRGH